MLHIRAGGAVTPLGLDLDTTVASLRAGLDRFQEVPFAGETGLDLKVSRIAGFLEGVPTLARYEALAVQAIEPCLRGLDAAQRATTAVLIGLPWEDRPGVPEHLAVHLRRHVAERLRLDERAVRCVHGGRTVVMQLLAQADGALRSGRLSGCVVGGVDCLVNAHTLRGLCDAGGQVKEDWDGFIPGEAAAFVHVQADAPPHGPWGGAAACISGIGQAHERADGSAQAPWVGAGLSAAYRAAIQAAGVAERQIDLLVNDLNGNRMAFEDAGYAHVRFFRSPRHHLETWHVASYLGETGAAAGALELLWAASAMELGHAPGPVAMLSTADRDQRLALVLQASGRRDATHDDAHRIGHAEPVLHRHKPAALPLADPGLQIDEAPLHAVLQREHLAELSWLHEIREQHLRGREPWADIEDFERRQLAHLDALAWAGPAAEAAARAGLQADEPSDVAAAAAVLLSRTPDGSSLDALCAALHMPGPQRLGVLSVLPHMPEAAMRPLLQRLAATDDLPLRRELLQAMSVSGTLTHADLEAQVQRSPEAIVGELVLAAASAGLANWGRPLADMIDADGALGVSGVQRVALLAIAPPGSAERLLAPRVLLKDMPVALALACLQSGDSFASHAAQATRLTPGLVEAWGWSGEAQAMPVLVEALRSDSPALRAAAANALYRLQGVACLVEVEEADSGTSEDGEAAPRATVRQLAQDAELWRAALRDAGRPMRWEGRLRHGAAWSPASSLQHLLRVEAGHAERKVAAWEHAIVNRAPLPLQPSWFVGRQKRAMAGWSS